MKMGYMEFVRKLIGYMVKETGFDQKRIYFKREGEIPALKGDRLFVVVAEREDSKEAIGLFARNLYERYLSGCRMEDIAAGIMKEVCRVEKSEYLLRAADMKDYGKIKKDLFVRPMNKNWNREKLADAVFCSVGDIALVLYFRTGESGDSLVSIMVTKEYPELWGVAPEELLQTAMKNTLAMAPPRFFSMEGMWSGPEEYQGEDFMDADPDMRVMVKYPGTCLTTARKSDGAAAVFLPGVAERIAELLNGSFLIAFTSVHEAMIHAEGQLDIRKIRECLKAVNNTLVPPEERLSYHVYRYDRDKKEFGICDENGRDRRRKG